MARYEDDDFGDEERVVIRTPEGRAAVLPTSARRLRGDALEAYAELMALGVQVAELEDRMTKLADESREYGVSWALIGAAVGLTGAGAQKRYQRDD
jgi:hypothetical protein